jgi:hypothetical protein
VIGKLDDFLLPGFIADLRPAEDDFDVRPDAFDGGDNFRGSRGVPDVNAETDDFGIACEKNFRNVERSLVDVKLGDARADFNSPRLANK